MKYYLITFPSPHSAMAGQSYLRDKIKFMIMPTLREISSSCGISIRILQEDFLCAQSLMEQSDIKGYKIYAIEGKQIELIFPIEEK